MGPVGLLFPQHSGRHDRRLIAGSARRPPMKFAFPGCATALDPCPMLAINDAMGFQPVAEWREWTLERG
jgi:hypothetical protein